MRPPRTLMAGLASLACAAPAWAAALDPAGRWMLPGGRTEVEIARCGEAICGRIASVTPPGSGDVRRDDKNPDPSLRERPLVGVEVLHGLMWQGREWSGGWIYNPGNGRRYAARAALQGDHLLQVQGCLAFVCRAQVWARAP